MKKHLLQVSSDEDKANTYFHFDKHVHSVKYQ